MGQFAPCPSDRPGWRNDVRLILAPCGLRELSCGRSSCRVAVFSDRTARKTSQCATGGCLRPRFDQTALTQRGTFWPVRLCPFGPPSKAVISNVRTNASRRIRIKGLSPGAGSYSAISVACGDNIEVHPCRGFPGGTGRQCHAISKAFKAGQARAVFLMPLREKSISKIVSMAYFCRGLKCTSFGDPSSSQPGTPNTPRSEQPAQSTNGSPAGNSSSHSCITERSGQ